MAIIGRFQPFHWGHFEYLLEAFRIGDRIVAGITNPNSVEVRESTNDVSRSSQKANPFSFELRREMIYRSVKNLCPEINVLAVPCDLRSADHARASIGAVDLVAITVYDAWGEEKAELFRNAGYEVRVLWERSEKITSGTQVRELMCQGRAWGHLVPSGTKEVLASDDGQRAIEGIRSIS